VLIKSKLNKDNLFLLSARAINSFIEENQDNLKFRLDYQKPTEDLHYVVEVSLAPK
jgi:hypothetical protein